MKAKKNHPQKPDQFEMRIDGGFRLEVESAEDGNRITQERAAEQERAEQAKRDQLPLFP